MWGIEKINKNHIYKSGVYYELMKKYDICNFIKIINILLKTNIYINYFKN